MRHLTTEELLLYAEGELEEQALCRHVPDCVDCKAHLVDIQESYVFAAHAIRSHAHTPAAQPAQLRRLRQRLAVEAELLVAHLSTEDLLLSVERGLDADSQAHLSACQGCQDRAADLHVQLAEIEVELHRRLAFEFPAERRAAALAALRARLQQEVELRTAEKPGAWRWLPAFSLPRIPAFTPYATAFATALLAVLGWAAASLTEGVPAPESLARLGTPGAPELTAVVPAARAVAAGPSEVSPLPRRFNLGIIPALAGPAAAAGLESAEVPEVILAVHGGDPIPFDLPALSDLPGPPPAEETLTAGGIPVTERFAPLPRDSARSVADGTWMLVQTGLWKQGFEAGGTEGRIRLIGSVASERDRLAAENALLDVSGGRPVDFEISVRAPRSGLTADLAPALAGQVRSPGGLVRSSLMKHFEDAARRSFQQPDTSLLEGELERYVSEVLRHDAELLSHVHALHSLLNRFGMDEAEDTDSFRKVVRFHLDGISRHEAGIYDRLSEALPRRFWAYRNANRLPTGTAGFGAASSELLEDALALDRALNSLLFPTAEALDARESNLSSATLLARVRQHARRLKAALRQ